MENNAENIINSKLDRIKKIMEEIYDEAYLKGYNDKSEEAGI